jgi:hypothetical protein
MRLAFEFLAQMNDLEAETAVGASLWNEFDMRIGRARPP